MPLIVPVKANPYANPDSYRNKNSNRNRDQHLLRMMRQTAIFPHSLLIGLRPTLLFLFGDFWRTFIVENLRSKPWSYLEQL